MRRLALLLLCLCSLSVVAFSSPSRHESHSTNETKNFHALSAGEAVPTALDEAAFLKKRAADIKTWNDAVFYGTVSKLHPATKVTTAKGSRPVSREARYGSGACGGDLPPCSVLACESGGDLNAHNPSGADGKWQIMSNDDGGANTWATTDTDGDNRPDAYIGPDGTAYDDPSDAPESVQDDRAREIYAGGAGRKAWVC